MARGATDGWPAGALVLLIGPSGAGKSTWARDHFEPDEVLSSDAFRAVVAGAAADQSATAAAFGLLHAALRARSQQGLLSVVDATNLTAGARRTLLRIGRTAARPVVAVVFDVSLERCLARNASRPDRQVPEAIVRRHCAQLHTAMAALPSEGYDEIRVLRDDDVGGS